MTCFLQGGPYPMTDKQHLAQPGQLQKAILAPELTMGSAKAAVGPVSQLGSCLTCFLPHSEKLLFFHDTPGKRQD